MTAPLVSIIIPVGPMHRAHVATALRSCRWQTVGDWQAIVVNDSGQPLSVTEGDERIQVVDAPERPGRRPSIARNAGIERAEGIFTIFLDADDYLLPSAIATFIRGHALHDAAYSYAHHYGLSKDGNWAQYRPPEYNRAPRASALSHSSAGPDGGPTLQGCNLHPITALVPTWCVREVGGFDEQAPGFEDWTIWLRLAIAGWCGQRVYGPTFVYRIYEGQQHRPDAAGGQALMDAVTAPYRTNRTGDITMAGCGCGGGARTAKEMARALAQTFGADQLTDTGSVVLEYTGSASGKQSLRHPQTRREIQFSARPAHRYIITPPEEVAYWLSLGIFRRQIAPAPFVPPPEEDIPELAAPAAAPEAPKTETPKSRAQTARERARA